MGAGSIHKGIKVRCILAHSLINGILQHDMIQLLYLILHMLRYNCMHGYTCICMPRHAVVKPVCCFSGREFDMLQHGMAK